MQRVILFSSIILGCLLIIGVGVVWFIRRPVLRNYDEQALPQFIEHDFIELDKVTSISKFRSGAGHDYSQGTDETCRSMKHYFTPQRAMGKDIADWVSLPDPATAIKIVSPVSGRIIQISSEQTPIGRQIHIRPTSQPDFVIRLFHVFPADGIEVGTDLVAGQLVGSIHADQGTDIAVEVNHWGSTQNFSYFAVMPDDLFSAYQERGVTSRTDLIISREERDANPLECDGEQFTQNDDADPTSGNYVYLSGYQPPGGSSFSSPAASADAIRDHRDEDEPPLLLKSIGFTLEAYDPATERAGDLLFTKTKLQFDRLWMDFGFTIPAAVSASGLDKQNPQPTFIVPLGTKVRSLVDGVVVEVKQLSSNDWTVMVAQDTRSSWIYETEHVVNPVVAVGDRVTAGQVVAEAGNFNNNAPAGFGIFEIGLLHGGNPPEHVCPFAYLDASVKDDIQAQIRSLYQTWEAYVGDPTLYDEASMPLPGCLTTDAIPG
ncbi:M23 family metallopeptidase [Candidatus Berkelbacteria bacterium]|nr:M23 family metallopeptidase [Candidatus Berkelbacteria bacterium]